MLKKEKLEEFGFFCLPSLILFFAKLDIHSLWTTTVHKELHIHKPKLHIFFFLRSRNAGKDQVKLKKKKKKLFKNAKSLLSLDYCAFSAVVTETLLFLHID